MKITSMLDLQLSQAIGAGQDLAVIAHIDADVAKEVRVNIFTPMWIKTWTRVGSEVARDL